MLLTIDVGNTNTKFAVFDGVEWQGQWRAATDSRRTADEYAAWLAQLLSFQNLTLEHLTHCVVSCVVPQALFNLRNLSRRYVGVEPLVIGEPDVNLGIQLRIDNPREAGADRLVNAIGAFVTYGGPAVVVDSGTATTFDVIGEDGGFEGGVISPGIYLSLQALHTEASRLPRIEIRDPGNVIGKNTVQAMQSGVFWGYIELIDGLVDRIRNEYGRPMKSIGTGGVASLFEGSSRSIDFWDQDLTSRGLLEVFKRNGGTL